MTSCSNNWTKLAYLSLPWRALARLGLPWPPFALFLRVTKQIIHIFTFIYQVSNQRINKRKRNKLCFRRIRNIMILHEQLHVFIFKFHNNINIVNGWQNSLHKGCHYRDFLIAPLAIKLHIQSAYWRSFFVRDYKPFLSSSLLSSLDLNN